MTDPATEPRGWQEIRGAITGVLRECGAADPEAAADAVLGIFDEEAMIRLGQEYAEASRLRSLSVRDGKVALDMVPTEEALAGWILAARGQLDGTGADNYTETRVEFPDRPRGERYAFILQRVGKLTPHEARQRAEAEAGQLRRNVEDLRQKLSGYESQSERAAVAEAKLAEIRAHCEAKAAAASQLLGIRVGPQDVNLDAGDVLAIISGPAKAAGRHPRQDNAPGPPGAGRYEGPVLE